MALRSLRQLGSATTTASRLAARVSSSGARRTLSTTRARLETFNVQDEEDFRTKVLGAGSPPTVVDFSATWCGPCKMLTPRLDAAVAAAGGKVNLAMVDIDVLSDLALDYGVQAVPTVLAVKDGEVVDKFVGLIEEDKIDAFIKKLTD